MELSELSQHWQDYQAKLAREQQEQQQAAARRAEAELHIDELQAHARRVGEAALALMSITGWEDDYESRASIHIDTRLGEPIRLGALDDSGKCFAIARVYIHRFFESEATTVKGLFGRSKKVYTPRPSDMPKEVGVRYYATDEEGEAMAKLATVAWTGMLSGGIHALDPVEHELNELSHILKPQAPTTE